MKKIAYLTHNTAINEDIEAKIDIMCKQGICRNNIFIDTLSETNSERPEKERMLTHLLCDNTNSVEVYVISVAELGRYNKEIKNTLQRLFESGAELIAIDDCIDTADYEMFGNNLKTMLVAIFQNLADKDRTELTIKQMKGRKMTDKKLGRPSFEPTDYFIEDCKDLQDGLITRDEILKKYSITKSTFYKYRTSLLESPENMTRVDRMRFFK